MEEYIFVLISITILRLIKETLQNHSMNSHNSQLTKKKSPQKRRSEIRIHAR